MHREADPGRRLTGRWAVETRQLTPSQAGVVLELLELLGHDPDKVGALNLVSTELGLRAEVTFQADPNESRLIVPTAAPVSPRPQLVIGRG